MIMIYIFKGKIKQGSKVEARSQSGDVVIQVEGDSCLDHGGGIGACEILNIY